MLIAHAVTLAEARSYVAALADIAVTIDASIEYDRVLLQIDFGWKSNTALPQQPLGRLRTAGTQYDEWRPSSLVWLRVDVARARSCRCGRGG